MKEWLTTHFPKRESDRERFDVYLQADHIDAADGIAKDDRVWFYEFATAKRIKDEVGRTPRGRQGIVCFARVTGPIYTRDRRIEYADGSVAEWSWGVPTGAPESGGFVSRATLCEILRHKPCYTFRGFNGGKGLKLLDDGEAAQLLAAFRRGTPPWRVPVNR